MAKKKNIFSAIGAGKMIKERKRKQQAMLDEMDGKPRKSRTQKMVEEAGGSYNQ